jgi:VanZ family protein
MVKKNIFSIIVALIIMYLSLASSKTFQNVPLIEIPQIDKIMHFAMYFGFMSIITFENRKSILTSRQLFLIALIPFLYGILMEIFQISFTESRFANLYDVVANSAGILTSLLFWSWLLFKYLSNRKIKL